MGLRPSSFKFKSEETAKKRSCLRSRRRTCHDVQALSAYATLKPRCGTSWGPGGQLIQCHTGGLQTG
eukprot:4239946-Amphidinium_carterae.1